MHLKILRLPTSLAVILCFATLTASAQGDAAAGKELFRNNCATCHNRDMKSPLTGPALGPGVETWVDYPREDLYAWIRNSQALIAKGHPHAVELWNQFKPTVMTPFPNLTDQDIENILAYIDQQYNGPAVASTAGGGAAAPTVAPEQKSDNTLLYVILLVVLGALALVLARVISNLNQIAQVQEGKAAGEQRTILQMLTSRGVIAFVIFALIVFGGYTTVNNAIAWGRQQGSAPASGFFLSSF